MTDDDMPVLMRIDPRLIDDGGLLARLDHDDAVQAELTEAIRAHGQHAPVALRPHPERPGRYQVIFGRRRIFAALDLGQPVLAMVRDLDEADALIAQGQENTARLAPSYIERAYFAHALMTAGFERPAIMAALHASKVTVSRMLTIMSAITPEVVRVIGAAGGIGRERWTALAKIWPEGEDAVDADLVADMIAVYGAETPDDRFEAVWAWLVRRNGGIASVQRRSEPQELAGSDGQRLGTVAARRRSTVVTLSHKDTGDFPKWLIAHLPELFDAWSRIGKVRPERLNGSARS